jgi:hypothetical protein
MRIVRRPRVLVAACAALVLVVSACLPQTPVGPNRTPIQGYAELSAKQLGDYVQRVYRINGGKVHTSCGKLPYRASVGPLPLAMYFVDEGNTQYIRGDIAFAQSILETGWFSFCGSVHPSWNNFAGIGATGEDDATPARFSHAAIGVRAQMQRLNRYANPEGASSLARPLVPQRGWKNASQYNNWWPSVQGTKTTWQSLTGVWATSTCYDTRVMRIYNQMRTHYGMAPMPVSPKPGC